MKRWIVEIHDAREGTVRRDVLADTEDEALEEASIAAAENGCYHVAEIIVYEEPS